MYYNDLDDMSPEMRDYDEAAADAWLAQQEAERTDLNLPAFPWSGVYFVSSGPLIKIGIGTVVHKRIRNLVNSSATPVRELGWIACDPACARLIEKSIHAQLVTQRQHAEWFTRTPELERFIERAVTACSYPRL